MRSRESSDVKVVLVDATRVQDVVDFLVRNYYRAHAFHFSEKEIEALPGSTASYFEKLKGEGRIYSKNGHVVGLILKNDYALHPAIEAPTTHVEYWGYDRGQITREDAQFMKNDWLEYLTSSTSADALIDCSIDWFNDKSLAFAVKLGFRLQRLRLDRRETQ